ncbi:MAG: acylphosphatase [Desulfurococcales archaeon]|nr:acylphosphatase [Desulfurococcales archaeon]
MGHGRVRAYLLVRGIVQGVFFRANMRNVAKKEGVTGWVRNLPDGESVEAVLEGERDRVERVVCWSLRGPPMAEVREVIVKFSEYKGEFEDFEVKY